jgi:protein-S-isoprenylcysteine O-methyltransferase Ste14
LEITTQHALVTEGVYRRIRHPMYASMWLWIVAQALLLQNWIVGVAGVVGLVPLYLIRVPREEQMMLDHFGEDYQAYVARTGRIVPRVRAK